MICETNTLKWVLYLSMGGIIRCQLHKYIMFVIKGCCLFWWVEYLCVNGVLLFVI